MDNRGEFLNNVAQALGRPLRLEPQAEDAPLNNYANERLTQLNQQQRCDAFIQFASCRFNLSMQHPFQLSLSVF